MTLGHLLWWKVGDVDISVADLDGKLDASVAIPRRTIPVDALRKVASAPPKKFDLDGVTLECSLAPVDAASPQMMNYHMVGTLTRNGVVQVIRKIGDVAFYKPPRGQHSKARLRVVVAPCEWPEPAEQYAAWLRTEYDRSVRGALDGQAIRRLVRGHLADLGAVYCDGPYFLTGDGYTALRPVFDVLGEGSFMHAVPVPDTAEQRAFLTAKEAL